MRPAPDPRRPNPWAASGLAWLVQLVRFIPEHYIQLTNQVLEMIGQQMKAAHGG